METVKIGKQEWSSENLNSDHFNNGDEIQQVESAKDWLKCLKNKTPAWCYFDNNPDNDNTFGKLYNSYAVMDVRGIAPEGWHIPTDEEWSELIEFLGGSSTAGKLLKSSSGWLEDGNGPNSNSFGALPGGYRTPASAQYKYSGEYGFWWSASQVSKINESVWAYNMCSDNEEVDRSGYGPLCGFSVRCVRNE
tara:strand:+ start:102 stop:677 length:576 start_codon:yes stop_codon:yes gene_type:complete